MSRAIATTSVASEADSESTYLTILKPIIPILAALNAFEAILSFCLFRIFGIDIELNPLISMMLNLDNSLVLFLGLKLGFSAVLVYYWKTAKGIRKGISLLALFGVVLYSAFFPTIQHYSRNVMPKVWCFRKRINPSVELLKPSVASKVPETPYLWH